MILVGFWFRLGLVMVSLVIIKFGSGWGLVLIGFDYGWGGYRKIGLVWISFWLGLVMLVLAIAWFGYRWF